MITITPRAAEQIRRSAEATASQGLALRVAVRIDEEEGRLDYGLGFDEPHENDLRFNSEGVEIVVAPGMKELLEGAVVDYVELNPGDFHFIVLNPNDPAHRKPKVPPGED